MCDEQNVNHFPNKKAEELKSITNIIIAIIIIIFNKNGRTYYLAIYHIYVISIEKQ